MAGNIPGTKYSTSSFLDKFGNIAQSSQYRAHIVFPNAVRSELRANNIDSNLLNEIGVLCKATSLPGSSLATHEIANDFYGVTQKNVYKRQFDNTIDLTFFIDADYQTLYTFEGWMEYIMPLMGQNLKGSNAYYTAEYPENYKADLYIHKFNKDYHGVEGWRENARPATYKYGQPGEIVYTFLGAFPQNISSAVVSYDPSSNLEFTVTFAYERYITDKTGVQKPVVSPTKSAAPEPLKSSGQDNPSSIFTQAKAAVEDLTRSEMLKKDSGQYWQKRRAWRKGGRSRMLNQPTFDHGTGDQATAGQNVNNSTQQIQDARNGVGSNTSVAASRSKSN